MDVRALDTTTWPGLAGLVERHNGVWGGCWCQFEPTDELPRIKSKRAYLAELTTRLFEHHGFTRTRRIGKYRWVVTRQVP